MKRRLIRWPLRIIAVIVLLMTTFIGLRYATGNFGTVQSGRVYRSAQPSGSSISRTLRDHHIKTVLNLRGENVEQAWYRDERDATLAAGAIQLDFPMASDQWLSCAQLAGLIDILEHADAPMLIHCEWGLERTGLVSALSELLRPNGSLSSAYAQFSLYYLFIYWKDGRVMRGHLDSYAQWLSQTHRDHSPATFRFWAAEIYQPGRPSREYWPMEVYPIKVVTRPNGARVAVWNERAKR